MSQTRRLAAILAADVAGYLRLMSEDNGRIGQCSESDGSFSNSFQPSRRALRVGRLPVETAGPDGRWREHPVDARAGGVMRPFTTGSDYVNQIGLETDEGSERIKAAYGANYERLVAIKNKYDPTNLFRHNQNIRPTV
jgi:FAD/FMN-containing dehydrogenase